VERDAIIDGSAITPGDVLIGLPSSGLHTNGFTLVRRIFSPVSYGDHAAELGRPLGEGLLRAEYEGFVMGRSHGIYFYPGQAVLGMAIRDEAPLVAPYPDDFFELKE